MYDGQQLSAEIIFQHLREVYEKWQGQGKARVVRRLLNQYEKHEYFQVALGLFKDYLLQDNTPKHHRYRREKITFFRDLVYVRETPEFQNLVAMVDSYFTATPKWNLVSAFEWITECFHTETTQMNQEHIPMTVAASSSGRLPFWPIFSLTILTLAQGLDTAANKAGKLDSHHDSSVEPPDFSTARMTASPLQHMLNQRMDIASGSEKDVKNCQDTMKDFAELAKKQTLTKQHLATSLVYKDFKFKCTDPLEIAKKTGIEPKEHTATFYAPEEVVYIGDKAKLLPELLNHELIHAYSFYINQGECRTKYINDAHTPVFPVTPENIKKYDDALKQGDARIERFQQLKQMHENGEDLDDTEVDLLNKYLRAAENCIPRTWNQALPSQVLEDYKKLIKTTQKNKKPQPFIINTDVGAIEILNAGQGEEMPTIRHVNPIDTVLHTPGFVKETLDNSVYRNKPDYYKLAEREAHTMQNLSKEGFETFYEEADKLRQKHIAECMDEDLVRQSQDMQKKMI